MRLGVARARTSTVDRAGINQRLEAAAYDFHLLLDREMAKAHRLGRRHEDAQRAVPHGNDIGGNGREDIANEVNLFCRQETAA